MGTRERVREGVPCVLIEGGAVSAALASTKMGNVRSDPKLYPKMSVLKVTANRSLHAHLYSFAARCRMCVA